MNTDEALADLWHFVDAGRGGDTRPRLVSSWIRTRVERNEPIPPELLFAVAEKPIEWPNGGIVTPRKLVSFIGRLAGLHRAQSVLDPICRLGVLLREVAATSGSQLVHGVEGNAEYRDIAQSVVGNGAKIFGDALVSPDGLERTYDLIVASPPLGMKVHGPPMVPGLGGQYRGEVGHALAAWAGARLSSRGTAMVVVTSAFLWSAGGIKAIEAIHASGCNVRALIHLPVGTFSHTRIGAYLAILQPGTQTDVFIGEVSDDPDHLKALLANYGQRKNGDQPALGRLCQLSEFRGFDAFVAEDRLERMVRARGWSKVDAESVMFRLKWAGSVDEAVRDVNVVFLRTAGYPPALLDPGELSPSAARECVCVSLDPKVADARYMVHWFNDSAIGKATLASVARGAMAMRLNLNALLATKIALPPLAEQRRILQGIEHLGRIRAEVAELETALWSVSEETDSVVERIGTVNREDRYEDWIETLPFPLASILWRHRAGGGSAREQYEVLLHFFEATAAFLATIHLSAFMTDDHLWHMTAQGLSEGLTKQRLSLDRATFGTWKMIVEYLSGRCRKLLGEDDGKELAARIYATSNPSHVLMLCDPRLLSVLQRANGIRNKTTGHGGAIGPTEAIGIHDELMALVHATREVFGRSWLGYELIQPSEGRYQGGVHRYKARRLMGSRSMPFELVGRTAAHAMESERLYLFDAIGQTGVLLQPLIRVMPSPERKANACFIFSRTEKEGARFVSYHFEEESSMTAPSPELDETFRRLHLFGSAATT